MTWLLKVNLYAWQEHIKTRKFIWKELNRLCLWSNKFTMKVMKSNGWSVNSIDNNFAPYLSTILNNQFDSDDLTTAVLPQFSSLMEGSYAVCTILFVKGLGLCTDNKCIRYQVSWDLILPTVITLTVMKNLTTKDQFLSRYSLLTGKALVDMYFSLSFE